MVEKTKIGGTKVVVYESIPKFANALEKSKAKRLYAFYDPGLLGLGTNWAATFIDSKEVVHGYQTFKVDEGIEEKLKPLEKVMEEKSIGDIDGAVRVSQRNGDIYTVFQTDSPDEEERVQRSYDQWLEAVKELPAEGTLVQYLADPSGTAIDAMNGKQHLISVLDGKGKRTLDNTLKELKDYKTRDNNEVVDWYRDLRNE